MALCDAEDLIAQACASGFTCRNEPELLAILNQLLCNFIASGGGGGGAAEVSQGNGAPVAAPANTALTYFYVDRVTGVVYFWNNVTLAWQ